MRWPDRDVSGLLLPAPALRLLPVGGVVPGRLGRRPRGPRPVNGVGVIAVEENDYPLVVGIALQLRAVSEKPYLCSIRIVIRHRQPDWLAAGMPILHSAMGQEAFLAVCPQMGIKRIAPFLRSELQHRAPLPLEALLQKLGQHALERLALKMVENDLGHDCVTPPYP